MGKNKNRNGRKKKPLTVEAKSLTSNGRPCNTLPGREKLTSRENVQIERKAFNKPDSETLTHYPLPFTDSTKVKTDQIPVNETKSSFNKMDTQNTLKITTDRSGYRMSVENEWDDFFNGTSKTNAFRNSDSQTHNPPVLVSDKMKTKVTTTTANETLMKSTPSFNKVCSQDIVSSSKEANSQDQAIKSCSSVVKGKMKPKVYTTTANEAFVKSKPSFNKICSQNVSGSRENNSQILSNEINSTLVRDKLKPRVDQRATNEALVNGVLRLNKEATYEDTSSPREDYKPRKIINIEKPTIVSKSSNGNFSSSLEASISNGTRPKINRLMHPETSKLSTQIVSKDLTENLSESLNICEKQYRHFHRTYTSWRKERLETIKKLEKLKNEIHNDQHMFNKTNALFKDLNVGSRQAKNMNAIELNTSFKTISIDFLTSLATLATDAASGITSVAQAFNIDNYMEVFTKIMEHDKEITKPLYAVRSLCLKQYQNVEEVYRKYHSDSFGSTVANVSNALNLEELWLDLKGDGKDKSCTVIDCMDKFFRVNLNKEAVDKVYSTVQDYSEKNPAALKACVSAGKICYDIYDAWSVKPKGTIPRLASEMVNKQLLNLEIAESSELHSMANNKYKVQSNLESDISDAIEGLKEEMNEIDNNFKKFRYSFEEKIQSSFNRF